MTDLLVLAAVLFGHVSRRLEGTVLTAPIVFVAAGALLGPAALGLVEFGLDEHTVLLLGEIALAIVLFTDAARINLSSLRQYRGFPIRLLGIGMPLTIALGTAAAALLLTDLTFWKAAIVLGLIVVEEAPLIAGRDEMVAVVALSVSTSIHKSSAAREVLNLEPTRRG